MKMYPKLKAFSLSGTVYLPLTMYAVSSSARSNVSWYVGVTTLPIKFYNSSKDYRESEAFFQRIAHNSITEEFSKTTAFIGLTKTVINPADRLVRMTSTCLFNLSTLNDREMLDPDSVFFHRLHLAATSARNRLDGELITSQSSFRVDYRLTDISNNRSIQEFRESLSSSDIVCGSWLCPRPQDACYFNTTTYNITCVNKCTQFETENSCTKPPMVYGVYVQGTCSYDQFYYPYCNCGVSTGNIMNNFYDGYQCVSVTFIVAMSASAGGFLLLIILLLGYVVHALRQTIRLTIYRQAHMYTQDAARIDNATIEVDIPVKAMHDAIYNGTDLYPYLRKTNQKDDGQHSTVSTVSTTSTTL